MNISKTAWINACPPLFNDSKIVSPPTPKTKLFDEISHLHDSPGYLPALRSPPNLKLHISNIPMMLGKLITPVPLGI